MKTFTMDELKNLEFKGVDIEACFGTPEAQEAFYNLCRQNPELKDELVRLVRSAFITGLIVMCNAGVEKLNVK